MEKTMTIRKAVRDDLGAITAIYNEAILHTVATFDTQPKTPMEQEAWFLAHGPRNPILVAEVGGEVAGWASLSLWSDRCAYSDTSEISIYIAEVHQGKGIGKQLIRAIVEEGKKAGLHTVIARITEGNQVSVDLHRSVGFEPIGVMKEVGRKFGKLLDVHLLQKIYR